MNKRPFRSIFDSPTKQEGSIWIKKTSESLDDHKDDVLMKGYLYKIYRDDSNYEAKRKYFYLTSEHLIYTKGKLDTKIRGIASLRHLHFRVDPSGVKDFDLKLILWRGNSYQEMGFLTSSSYRRWLPYLDHKLIGTELSTNFVVSSKVEKSKDLKIYYASYKQSRVNFELFSY